MNVICIEQPDQQYWVCTDISVGKIYEVGFEDTHDYQLIDDNKNMRWYNKSFFEPLNDKK